ncbi:MAG: hypothetical protein FRX49_01803 [Trebouxia sp. A1-2]|nr:MAG: hypothetical protein FRX49_01803 [Trebouxia sp. A1-2]
MPFKMLKLMHLSLGDQQAWPHEVDVSITASAAIHLQIGRPGHQQWGTTSDVPTPTFGPNKSHPAQGHWKQTGEGGGAALKPGPPTGPEGHSAVRGHLDAIKAHDDVIRLQARRSHLTPANYELGIPKICQEVLDDWCGNDIANIFCITARERLESNAYTLPNFIEHRPTCDKINHTCQIDV